MNYKGFSWVFISKWTYVSFRKKVFNGTRAAYKKVSRSIVGDYRQGGSYPVWDKKSGRASLRMWHRNKVWREGKKGGGERIPSSSWVVELWLTLLGLHGLTVACQAPLWDFPGKNTGVSCHFLLQRIFPIQGSNQNILPWQEDFFTTEPPGKPLCSKVKAVEMHGLSKAP